MDLIYQKFKNSGSRGHLDVYQVMQVFPSSTALTTVVSRCVSGDAGFLSSTALTTVVIVKTFK